MIGITGDGSLSARPTRREWLALGSLLPAGLALPQLLAAKAPARAKSCLLIFMEGGPSHIDLWDMKPHAPAEVRGEFKPIATRLPGVYVCDQLPRFARHVHRFTQLRSMRHTVNDHNAGTYYHLTGRSPVEGGKLIIANAPTNFPPLRLRPGEVAPPRRRPPRLRPHPRIPVEQRPRHRRAVLRLPRPVLRASRLRRPQPARLEAPRPRPA